MTKTSLSNYEYRVGITKNSLSYRREMSKDKDMNVRSYQYLI